jgi:hypothetical protein
MVMEREDQLSHLLPSSAKPEKLGAPSKLI